MKEQTQNINHQQQEIPIHTPSRDTCMALFDRFQTPAHVRLHCEAVARTSIRMGDAIRRLGNDIDLALLESAALLHDLVRTQENHGEKASAILRAEGYPEVADLVEDHMSFVTNPYVERITEHDLLCLADRMVIEGTYVGLAQRTQYILNKVPKDPDIQTRVKERLATYHSLKERIEKMIGCSIDELMG